MLSQKDSPDADRLELQARLEDKLQGQVSTLLTPMLGDGNFTSEIQVELDMDQTTTARESYDKQGVVRSETQAQSQSPGAGTASGIPGALSNTPPPAATPSPGAPAATPTPAATPSPAPGTTGESSATRTYELGREVAVANHSPGKVKRLSVAVALSQKAMAKFKQSDIDQIKQLVSAAVGADPARGDQIAVVVRSFDSPAPVKIPFYEAPWFNNAVHHGVLLLGVLLVLLLGVRPFIKALKRDPVPGAGADGEEGEAAVAQLDAPPPAPIDADLLGRHVSLAQQIAMQKPESAVIALRQMLQPGATGEAA